MSQPTQQKDKMWTFPETVPARADLVSAELVEKGIKLQHIRGTDCAADYLKANGIGIDVAIRVLSRPSKRRKYIH
jgi:hypothetical protein